MTERSSGQRGKVAPRHIDSAANPFVKDVARLKDRRARQKTGLYLIEGVREAGRALAGGVDAQQLLVAPELVSEPGAARALTLAAESAGAELVMLSAAAFGRLSMRDNPDGVALLARSRKLLPADVGMTPGDLVLIVDGLEKPGNLGALLRTADAVGVDALLLCGSGAEGGGTDLENPNVIRASMGSLFSLPVAAGSREQVAHAVEAAGLTLVASTPHAQLSFWQADLTGGVALLLGAESAGLSAWWFERAALKVKVPMRATAADSLNVSVAGALLLYEAYRQRTAGAG